MNFPFSGVTSSPESSVSCYTMIFSDLMYHRFYPLLWIEYQAIKASMDLVSNLSTFKQDTRPKRSHMK